MEQKNQLNDELNLATSLKLLATAYEEISVVKMRLARDNVLHTRDFLVSLSEIFVNAKSTYNKLMSQGSSQHGLNKIVLHATNGKTVFVFLSAENKLYGDILSKTFNLFVEKVIELNPDITIVGSVGRDLYEASPLAKKPYTFFRIPDFIQNIEDLKSLITHILHYEHVKVFYGRFVNVINQEAMESSISGDEPLESERTQASNKEYGFIFEPSLEEVLRFFESQIFSSFFKQTVVESELARLASRIKAMEQAIGFIGTRITTLESAQRRMAHLEQNKKQMERLSGMRMWNK